MASTPRQGTKRTLHAPSSGTSASETVRWGREVLEAEARAIQQVTTRLDGRFEEAVAWLQACTGAVVVTAIGKPGFVAQKLSATLASTGVRSFYLHPAEAVHGDLGRVARGDVVLALSNSGASEELVRLLPSFRALGAKVVALTGDPRSALGRGADLVLDMGPVEEACPMGLVPTASSAALHALSDALAMALTRARRFTQDDYAQFHPGGKLGRRVMRVQELMRTGDAVPKVRDSAPLREGVAVMTRTPGRPGATLVVNARGKMVGIFTDGDLRRLVESRDVRFDVPLRTLMAKNPRSLGPDEKVLAAVELMRKTRVDQLPVVDGAGRPVGLLDVQDLLAAGFV